MLKSHVCFNIDFSVSDYKIKVYHFIYQYFEKMIDEMRSLFHTAAWAATENSLRFAVVWMSVLQAVFFIHPSTKDGVLCSFWPTLFFFWTFSRPLSTTSPKGRWLLNGNRSQSHCRLDQRHPDGRHYVKPFRSVRRCEHAGGKYCTAGGHQTLQLWAARFCNDRSSFSECGAAH